MPQQVYEITAPNGRVLEITGDRMPNEGEIRSIFKKAGVEVQTPRTQQPREPGLATIGQQLEAKGQHPHARVGQAVMDAAKGAGAGVMSTIYHGGDLIRRGLGMERVIDRPEVQQSMTPPDSFGGQLGFYGEQAAEFAIPLSRLTKATKGAGLVKRAAVDAGASTGVAAVQSGGDQAQMGVAAAGGAVLPFAAKGAAAAVRGVRNAAAGAREGGIGGAVAGAVRAASPPSSKAMLTQGLKPANRQVNFERVLDQAIPQIKAAEAALGRPIATVDDLIEATAMAKKRVRADYDAIAGPLRDKGSLVDITPVGEAMENSIPYKVRLENPEKADAILAQAKKYRMEIPLEKAELLLRETNAELESFYGKFPMAQRKALNADPEVARLNAQAKALRDAIYKTLDVPDQPDAARALNRAYGALMEVEDTALRRANVAKRQQPESLSEQIGGVRAAGDMARGAWRIAHGDLTGAADIASGHAQRSTAKFLKDQQTTDALIRRAFANMKPAASASAALPR